MDCSRATAPCWTILAESSPAELAPLICGRRRCNRCRTEHCRVTGCIRIEGKLSSSHHARSASTYPGFCAYLGPMTDHDHDHHHHHDHDHSELSEAQLRVR